MKVSFLSTYNAPLLGYVLQAFEQYDVPIHSILFDEKDVSEKDALIHQERTQGMMPPLSLFGFEHLEIPIFCVKNHGSETTAAFVRKQGIDILINAGTPRILKQHILEAPRVGVMNCHPGLLPRYRGCTCVEWAIFNDEQVGNTAHFMSLGIDEGPVILQEGLTFRKSDRYPDIRTAVYRHSCELLARATKKVIDEHITIASLPAQDEQKAQYWNVIPPEKMQAAIDKLQSEKYAFQL